jgi:hypothetical protein
MVNDEKLHPHFGKLSVSQGDGVLGNGAWGMGHGKDSQCPMPNAQSRRAVVTERSLCCPSKDTWGWSFPPTSNETFNET